MDRRAVDRSGGHRRQRVHVSASIGAAVRVRGPAPGLGVRLAADYFATGCSTLHSLRRLPVDVLKIGRSFLESLGSAPQAAAVIRAIVEPSHTMRLTVVAEGGGTQTQLDVLAPVDCDACQG